MTTSSERGWVSATLAKALLAVSLVSAGGSAQAVVCRVAVDGASANTGASWAAPKDLHGALGDVTCSEIWVKQGVYRPSTPASIPPSVRAISFRVTRELALYGGFAGSETALGARDPQLNRTILSGDIAGDDLNADGNFIAETTADIVGNNSHRVVHAGGAGSAAITNATVIDGFTITAGQMTALEVSLSLRRGGGLFCHASAPASVCSPRLNAIEFRGNLAAFNGGAMSNWAQATDSISSPTLTRVRFSGNSAALGGAMQNETGGVGNNNGSGSPNSSSPILTEVSFAGNSAQSGGGAMHNVNSANHSRSSPVLTQVSFVDNTATNGNAFGGALYNECRGGRVSPSLNQVTFSGNTGGLGGAMGIHATENGGRCHPELNQVTFVGNSARLGGAIAVVNIRNNFATSFGLRHVVLWGNTASELGQQILIDHAPGNVLSIDTSVIEGGCVVGAGIALLIRPTGAPPDPPVCGPDNLAGDPLLGPLQDNGGFTLTHLPGPASSTIDTGDNSQCGPVDQRGIARPQDGDDDGTAICDIGAVEVEGDTIFADGFEPP